MNLYLHICYLSHFFIFVYMWFSYAAYFIFPISLSTFEKILSKWSRWPIYRYIIYYCVIFCLHILFHTCFVVSWDIFSVSANLFAVIIMSISTHSHGSAKQWWHGSWSMVWYMLTSRKISFVKTSYSYNDMDFSVILQVMS